MSGFWTAFVAGIASGIVLAILGVLIRTLLRRRSAGESPKLRTKELRPLVAVAIGFALIFIDIFLIADKGTLMAIGGMVLLWSAFAFLWD